MNLELVAAVVLYTAILVAVGLWFPKKLAGFDSFFLGSRQVGAPRVAFSLVASWIGAASLLVSTDEAFRSGVSAYWIIGLPAVATLLLFLFLTGPIRALGGATISDRMEDRYGRAARPVMTFLIVWYMMLLAGSQMVAAGEFLGTMLGTSYIISLAVAAAVVLIYTMAGGFVAVVRTHALQFFLLAAGVLGLVASLAHRSSWHDVGLASARLGKSGYFSFFSGGERNALVALSFILAWTISPIAWQRIQSARSTASARLGLAGAAAALAVFYAGIVAAGMLFLPLSPQGTVAVPLVIATIRLQAGSPLAGLIFVTVLAAILSTMAAAVNTGAFSLARDLIRYSRGTIPAARELVLARAATLFLGAGAFLVAARFKDILTTLGLASKVLAEGLFIPGLAALLLKKTSRLAGLLSMGAGGGYALVCFFGEAGLLRVFPVLPWPWSLPLGISLSALGFVLGLVLDTLLTRRRRT